MKTIEFKAKVQAKSVEGFIDSIRTEDSEFEILKISDDKYEIGISNKHHSLLIPRAGLKNRES